MTSDFISLCEKWINPLFGYETIDDFTHRELVPLSHFAEKNSQWILEVDLPRVKKKDVEVTLTNDHIVIMGKLSESYSVSRHGHITKFEIFKKILPLPPHVNQKEIMAKFDNGILTIRIPKITMGKKIPIK